MMTDFLEALAKRVAPNDTGHVIYKRMALPPSEPPPQAEGELLRTNVLFKHIQVRGWDGGWGGDGWVGGGARKEVWGL